MIKIKKKELSPESLISLRSVPELSGIDIGDITRIGSMTTITEILSHPTLGGKYPILIAACKRMANVQIRNVATIGGNLCNCSPCADTATPLLVHDAKVRLQSLGGKREIPISEFFIGPGHSSIEHNEVLTDILIPSPPKQSQAYFMKKGRVQMDLAIASSSVLVEKKGNQLIKARIAVGSVAPVPLRLSQVESILEKSILTKGILEEVETLAAKSVSPISDIRASEEYRRHLIGVFVRQSLENLNNRSFS